MMHDADKELEEHLRAARARPIHPPAGLVDRVLADAEAEKPPQRPAQSKSMGFLPKLRARFGQWGAVGGLAAACSVGFWLGINPPMVLDGVSIMPQPDTLEGTVEDAAELSGFGWDLEEI